MKIMDVFPTVHLHRTCITSSKWAVKVTELCLPAALEIMSDGHAQGDAEESGRLLFYCCNPNLLDAARSAVAGLIIQGKVRYGKFFPLSLCNDRADLICESDPRAAAAKIILCAPGGEAVIWFGHGGAVWSLEYGSEDEKFEDIRSAIEGVFSRQLKCRVVTGKELRLG